MKAKYIKESGTLRLVNYTDAEYRALLSVMTKKTPDYKHNPRVKLGIWDGNWCFMEKEQMSSGLWRYAIEAMASMGCRLDIEGLELIEDHSIVKADFKSFTEVIFANWEKKPRDYQIESAYMLLRGMKCLGELATSAGKSLIIYTLIEHMLSNGIQKVMVVVPTTDLVTQLCDNFNEYNPKSRIRVLQVFGAAKKDKKKVKHYNVAVGTYQSLTKKDAEYMSGFGAVIVDEVHTATNDSIRNIISMMSHAKYRIGVTGTIPKEEYSSLMLQQMFGPIVTKITASELIEHGHISNLHINVVKMRYLETDKSEKLYELYGISPESRKNVFEIERKLIMQNEKRLKFLCNGIASMKNNTLVLFAHQEYGTAIYNRLKQMGLGREIYYVDGDVSKSEREYIISNLEEENNKIGVCSFGTFSTGISINAIYNIFLAESYKAETIVRQSAGRGLRKHEGKDLLQIYDFVDDYSVYEGTRCKWKSYMLKHANERMSIYREQKFPYSIKEVSF